MYVPIQIPKQGFTRGKELINKNIIIKELEQINCSIEAIEDFLSQDITGGLHCIKSNGSIQYLVDEKYLKVKDRHIAKMICLRDYYKKIKPMLENERRVLTSFINEYNPDRIDTFTKGLPDGRKLLLKDQIMTTSDKLSAFENEVVHGKSFDENDFSEFYTSKGERVRSKSEILIANELARKNIPYKYERPLILHINGKEYTFYPDFTVMCPYSGRIKYLEHLGKMDSDTYFQNTLSKLDAFERNGLLVGRDVLILHETASVPLSVRVINKYIDEFMYY